MDWIEGLLRVYERTRGRGHTRVGLKVAAEEGALYIVQTHSARTALEKHPGKPMIVTVAELPEIALGRAGPVILDNQVVISLLDEARLRYQQVRALESSLKSRVAMIASQQGEIARLIRIKEDQQLQITRLNREQGWRYTWWGRWLYRIVEAMWV